MDLQAGQDVLSSIILKRGMLWEKIEEFNQNIKALEGAVSHKVGNPQEEEMKAVFPLKQHIEGGLYTRELFMPKDSVIVSMIHKQQHPSFLLKGKVSYITDEGEIKTIKAPHTIFTQIGTQRVFYMHEDSDLCCVYKTEAKTFEEAEADVYTDNYRELPKELINKNKILCQEHYQD
tara:strand:- start:902 stop:1429 length:528 start_codon:yes stop_codon:yes gene_type:complete